MTDSRMTAAAAPEGAGGDAPTVMAPARTSTAERAESADWRDGLPDPLRRVADKFGSPADVVKSYAALERRLGRSVAVPGDDATPAERDAFYARLGRPRTPEDYRTSLPDAYARPGGDAEGEARLSGFLAAVHAAGAAPPVVRAAVDWYERARAEAEDAAARRMAAARAEADRALRREWGPGYDRRLALAQRAVRHFGGNDLAATLDRSGLGNDPGWVRAFARIGEALAEDTLVSGDPVGGARDTQARIDAIMTEHFGRPSYASPGVQSELRTLYESLYGSGPARGDAA